MNITPATAKAFFESEDGQEALLNTAYNLAYRLVRLRRMVNGESVPTDTDDPVFSEMQDDAWVEMYLADM